MSGTYNGWRIVGSKPHKGGDGISRWTLEKDGKRSSVTDARLKASRQKGGIKKNEDAAHSGGRKDGPVKAVSQSKNVSERNKRTAGKDTKGAHGTATGGRSRGTTKRRGRPPEQGKGKTPRKSR